MTIKYIVLSGGGPALGLLEYGVIKELSKKNILKYENIKSLYCTSVGSIIGLIYTLNYDWEWIDDFLIKRPWEKLINFDTSDYLNIFNTKGILDESFLLNCLKPLLLGKDLNINITLKELYEYSKINLYFYTTELNNFNKIEISHKSYPNLSVIKALTMSSSVPFLFKPVYYNNNYYLDGGICINTPINECLLNEQCNIEEIIVLENDKNNPIDCSNNFYINNNYKINTDSSIDIQSLNLLNYLMYIIKKIFSKISTLGYQNSTKISYTINCSLNYEIVDLKYWYYISKNSSERSYLIDLGTKCVNTFILDNSNTFILDNSDTFILDNSNTFILDNSDTFLLDNSDTFLLDNSDTFLLDNSDTFLLDNSDTFLLDNSNITNL